MLWLVAANHILQVQAQISNSFSNIRNKSQEQTTQSSEIKDYEAIELQKLQELPLTDFELRSLTSGNYCGDGWESGAEECDDGNTVPGDGCDGSCLIEDDAGEWGCAKNLGHSVCTEDSADNLWYGGLVCNDADGDDAAGCTDDGTTINAGYYCEHGVL
jgi:cysteine-rich repeat protein